jgi:hypothetical protein
MLRPSLAGRLLTALPGLDLRIVADRTRALSAQDWERERQL